MGPDDEKCLTLLDSHLCLSLRSVPAPEPRIMNGILRSLLLVWDAESSFTDISFLCDLFSLIFTKYRKSIVIVQRIDFGFQ